MTISDNLKITMTMIGKSIEKVRLKIPDHTFKTVKQLPPMAYQV